jgi:xanthosine utilization system XapX-like protein
MAEESRQTHRDAVQRVHEAQTFAVTLPVLGRVRLPRPEQLAFYGALGALAAVEIIEWPIALVLGVGHALMQNEHSRVAHEVGEALEDA